MSETDEYDEDENGTLMPKTDVSQATQLVDSEQSMGEEIPPHDQLSFDSDNDNHDPAKTMVVRLPAQRSENLPPNFICLICKCTVPGAMMTTACDIMEQLSIWNVTLFNAIVADSNEMESRE